MEWKTEIKLTYRIFVRQHRNVEDQFKDVLAKVQDRMGETADLCVDVGQCEDLLIPIRELDVEQAEKDGKLVIERTGGKLNLLVYQWRVTVTVYEDADGWLERILQSTGQVWTNVQILKECVTDVVPI